MHPILQSKLNCEVLYDDLAFEVRWAIAGDSIVLQLVAKLENREYMSFGISGDDRKSKMIGGDLAVAWIDKETLKGYAVDYYLNDKSQCSGPKGSCPDERILENTNNIRLLNAATVNGYSIVTYQRPLKASDELDKQIITNATQPIIWAIGPLNQRNEVSFHSQYTKRDTFLDFGRTAKWNCPMPEGDQPTMKSVQIKEQSMVAHQEQIQTTLDATTEINSAPKATSSRTRNGERRRVQSHRITHKEYDDSKEGVTKTRQIEKEGNAKEYVRTAVSSRNTMAPAPVSKRNAWSIPPIQCNEPEDGVFYAQMGPTGGKRGYPAITGHVGWGISWYINGLLIPEINLVRGTTYTFVVEGGFDREVPAKYHPFYITDDPVGGYEYKNSEERKNVRIFAGATTLRDGTVQPTGVGRLCHWTQQGDSDADDFASFGAYQRTLELKCDQGEPGVIQWTPDEDTPDSVYYQCFTHRYLGWKINVLDECDDQKAASELEPIFAVPDKTENFKSSYDDLAESPSMRVETRIRPNNMELFNNKEIVSNKESIKGHELMTQDKPINLQTSFYLEQPFYLVPEHSEPMPIVYHENPTIAPIQIDLKNTIFDLSAQQQYRPEIHLQTIKTTEHNLSSERNNLNQTAAFSLQKVPPKHSYVPTKILRKPVPNNRPSPIKYYVRPNRLRQPPTLSKKAYYRPIIKVSMEKQPETLGYSIKLERKPILQAYVQNRPKLMLKPQVINPPIILNEPERESTMHVEISPQQASTERELETQTFKTDLLPAFNTGFHPESVVIEGGFRPIIHKKIERRVSKNDGPELKYESAIGVIDRNDKSNENGSQNLEPVFLASPLDNPNKNMVSKIYKRRVNPKKNYVRILMKGGRSELNESLENTDELAEAAERVESYYLPPDNRKPVTQERPVQPSNIDIAPGTVVTYDGKKVSGASLTIRINDGNGSTGTRSSKATELIKATPQFKPFRGELPPLEPIVDKNAPQLKLRGVLNRNLDSPDLPLSSGFTKLSPIKQFGRT